MKKLLLLFSIALATLVSCNGNKDEESSLEGRWNIYKTEDGYSFSLIFKGNKLDVYIIAWGEHIEGTYTYSDNEITYNITKAKKAWTGVTFDKDGNMTSYSWDAGHMNQETFVLDEGYGWYDLPESSSDYPGYMLNKFKFEITSATTAETDLLGGTAYKVK